MNGRILVIGLLGFSLMFGGVLWYFQNYAYYEQISLAEPQMVQKEALQPTEDPAENSKVATEIAEAALAMPKVSIVAETQQTENPETSAASVNEDEKISGADATKATALNTMTAATNEQIELAALPTTTSIKMTRVWDNLPEVILAEAFEGIDAQTSPLKFKACFRAGNSIPMMTETYVVYETPTPLKAPVWFRCYKHKSLSEDLESGEAIAFLGEANITYGIDRVVAIYGDGRGFAWHQINECGEAAFAGTDMPADCPQKPER